MKSVFQKPIMSRVLLCLIPLGFYFSFSLHRLRYPGLHTDEAKTALLALDLLKLGYWKSGSHWTLSSLALPAAMTPYHGAFESYLLAPFICVMGSSPEALRLFVILLGGLTLILFFGFLLLLTQDSALAWLGTMLLALHPGYVTGTRMGLDYGNFILFCVAASLLCFLAWAREGKRRYLYAACFVLGAGAASRSWFWAHVMGLAAAGIVLLRSSLVFNLGSTAKNRWRTLAIAILYFPRSLFSFHHLPCQKSGNADRDRPGGME